MKGFFTGLVRGIFGKQAGAFTGGLYNLSKNALKANPVGKLAAMNSMHALKTQMMFALPFTLFGGGTPEEKMQGLAANVGAYFLTMGMNSPWRQALWGMGISMAPQFAGMARGIVQGYRGTLEARTSAAIPFSHSSVAMDQAFATMQYSRQRMSEANSFAGAEASFFAARYMAR